MAGEKDLEKTKEIMQDVVGLAQAEADIRKQLLEYNQQLRDGAGYFLSQEQRILEKRKIVIATYKKELEELKKLRKLDKEHEKHSKEQEKLIKARLKHLKENTEEYKKQDGMLKKMEKSLKEIGTKAFTSFVGGIVKGFTALDDMSVSFAKATGTGREYNKFVIDNVNNMKKFLVGNADASRIVGDLYSNLNQFYVLSNDEKTTLLENNALMEKFGVSSQDSSVGLDILTKSLKFSTQEAASNQQSIVKLAKSLQIAPKNMIADFNKAAPTLAKYGKQSVEVFKKLQIEAKSTGVSMNSLLGITQQFDTFEGAAEAAGQLNAILGGGLLNSTELLMADEAQRVKLLKEAVSASGKSWESMNRFERQAIASAAGIQDMNEATRMFGKVSEEEMEKAADAGKLVGDSSPFTKKEAQDQILAATTAMEKLSLGVEHLMNKLGETVFQDMIKSIDEITRKILEWLPAIDAFFKSAKEKMSAFLNWEIIGGHKVSDILAAALPVLMIGGGMGAASAVTKLVGSVLTLPKTALGLGKSLVGGAASLIGGMASAGAGALGGGAATAGAGTAAAGTAAGFGVALGAAALAGAAGYGVGTLIEKGITAVKIGDKKEGEDIGDWAFRKINGEDAITGKLKDASPEEIMEQRKKIRESMEEREKESVSSSILEQASIEEQVSRPPPEANTSPSVAESVTKTISNTASSASDAIAKIILNLDGKELANAIIPLINKSMDLTILR